VSDCDSRVDTHGAPAASSTRDAAGDSEAGLGKRETEEEETADRLPVLLRRATVCASERSQTGQTAGQAKEGVGG
jgi:hypothetical protein